MKKLIIFVVVLFVAIFGAIQAQTTQGQQLMQSDQTLKLTIRGTINKTDQGYFILRKGSREVFKILNPKPLILNDLVKSGAVVSIVARSSRSAGDMVKIRKINGEAYR